MVAVEQEASPLAPLLGAVLAATNKQQSMQAKRRLHNQVTNIRTQGLRWKKKSQALQQMVCPPPQKNIPPHHCHNNPTSLWERLPSTGGERSYRRGRRYKERGEGLQKDAGLQGDRDRVTELQGNRATA